MVFKFQTKLRDMERRAARQSGHRMTKRRPRTMLETVASVNVQWEVRKAVARLKRDAREK